jgi:pyridoxamine 5'-phosphate oxidase
MKHPIDILQKWLTEEKERGAPDPHHTVLSTATDKAIPHGRIVHIREITSNSLLFFTKKGTRKFDELQNNPRASMTFWFELYQREVMIDGLIERLSEIENEHYWQTKTRDSQIRFYSYAADFSRPISNKQELENKRVEIESEYRERTLPRSPSYCGFRLKPFRMVFYAFRADELSDALEYQLDNAEWRKKILSP